MELTSITFTQGQPIPKRFTGVGENVSPPLHWDDAPADTKQFVLTCVDIDAPSPEPWVHWLMYEIPATTTSFPENIPAQKTLESGALHGLNSFAIGNIHGYQGPMPHSGTGVHRYVFTIYALGKKFDLEAGLHLKTVLSAMEGHVLDQAELMGTYER